MGMPVRTSLARILLVPVALGALPVAARAAEPPTGPRAAPAPVKAGPARATSAGQTGRRDAFVPGRVLVGFQAGAGERGGQAAAGTVGGRVVTGSGRTRVVELGRGADVPAAARRLAARPGVAYAEPDWIRRVDACDPDVCWHLQPRPGANAVAAHHDGFTGHGRTVAVVDTGVADHPDDDLDLENRVTERWRCRDTGCLPAVAAPTSSHGTEVASVVAAADDDDGSTGVAPDATVVSYRVDSSGGGIPISYLRSALLQIAADDQVDVVNLSLGGSQWSAGEQEAIDAVLDAGKAVVASAGNSGDRIPRYPAAFPGVISVGATDDGGGIAGFSSFGKVDVVAPGACVAVAEVAGFDQDNGCPGDAEGDGVAYSSGTSFAAPIASGLLALAGGGSPLLARLALEASADGDHAGGAGHAKQWAHGLVDADAFVAAHAPGAPPSLVLETSGPLGSANGQLPRQATTYRAYAFQVDEGIATSPGTASFSQAAAGSAAFAAVDGEPGVFLATLATGPLDEGPQEELVSATVGGELRLASLPVLVLAADDQAPGVPLVGAGDDAWRRLDGVDGDDLDDVYAVTLRAGDRLDVAVAGLSDQPVAVLLFDRGTDDVFGQLDRALTCGGGVAVGCGSQGLHFEAEVGGTYLVDVFSTGPTGDYRLTWTVRNAAGLPIEVPVPACSRNGDGVRDRCAWTAGAVAGWATTSFVTSGATRLNRQAGAGSRTWDGRDEEGAARDPGRYMLRILYTGPGGRALLRAFVLTLDEDPPGIVAATASPNPFEPRPDDGDRDTTAFAMTSTEPGRLRVVVYRRAGTTAVRVLVSGPQAAGRQRVAWSGRRSSGAWLRGRFSYVIEAVDGAGNTARSRRHHLRVL
jgi:Subtilase family